MDGIYTDDDMVESWRNYQNFVQLVRTVKQSYWLSWGILRNCNKCKDSEYKVLDTALEFSPLEVCIFIK